MNILLISDDFYPKQGGIAHTLRCLCKSFKETKHNLYIINPFYRSINIYNVLKFKKLKFLEIFKFFFKYINIYVLIQSIRAVIIDKKIKLFDRINLILYLFTKPELLINTISNIKSISPIFKKVKPDIILTAHSGNILPLGFVLSRLFNKKIISMTHGTDFLVRKYLSLKHFYFKNIDMFIVSNEWIKRLLNKIHKLNRIRIINRAIILKEFEISESKQELRKEFHISTDDFVLLSVGRHVKRKNFDLVIKAVKEIINKKPNLNIKYFLIGEGPVTVQLKALARKLNLSDHVKFLGVQNTIIRNKFYKLSDVFIMPAITEKSNIEGFGIVFIEANYYRIPVIGSHSGGIVEAINDGETGFLIEPNNLNQLVEKLLFLFKNEELRKIMGELGYKRVLNEFSWEKIVNDYLRVFKEVMD